MSQCKVCSSNNNNNNNNNSNNISNNNSNNISNNNSNNISNNNSNNNNNISLSLSFSAHIYSFIMCISYGNIYIYVCTEYYCFSNSQGMSNGSQTSFFLRLVQVHAGEEHQHRGLQVLRCHPSGSLRSVGPRRGVLHLHVQRRCPPLRLVFTQ